MVENSGPPLTFDTSTVVAMPPTTPNTATPIGSPIANTEPVAKIKMTTAKASPMSSDSGGSNPARASPPISTRRPSSSGIRSRISSPIAPDSSWSISDDS